MWDVSRKQISEVMTSNSDRCSTEVAATSGGAQSEIWEGKGRILAEVESANKEKALA